jgi:archaemetzincin
MTRNHPVGPLSHVPMTSSADRLHRAITLGAAAAALALAGLFSVLKKEAPPPSSPLPSTAAPVPSPAHDYAANRQSAGAAGATHPPRLAAPSAPAAPARTSRFSEGALRRRAAEFARVGDDPAFRRLDEPQPFDWLWAVQEPGQTLAEYAGSSYNRKTPRRLRLHLLPLAIVSPETRRVIPPLVRFLSLYFDTPVTVLPERPMARRWHHASRNQYDAGEILAALVRQVPSSSLGLFGLTDSDLYAESLNFVFGYASLEDRAGVYSVHRFGTRPKELLLRTLKLAAHEIGHVFSLDHCVFYACLMNGGNSLAEADRSPVHLCPVCHDKLRLALGFDPVARHRRLRAFYQAEGLTAEAAFAWSQLSAKPVRTNLASRP